MPNPLRSAFTFDTSAIPGKNLRVRSGRPRRGGGRIRAGFPCMAWTLKIRVPEDSQDYGISRIESGRYIVGKCGKNRPRRRLITEQELDSGKAAPSPFSLTMQQG